MSRSPSFEQITKGAIAGLVAGLVGSWAANQFHSLWSYLAGEEQNPDVARLSDRGGRPDTAAAKENAASGEPPEEDATVAIASKISNAVFEHSLTKKEKHRAGVAVHYSFGAVSGALYGAVSEVAPLARILSGAAFGVGIWLAAVEVALPALKLTQPPWRYPFRMHAYSLISHLVYGTVTEQSRKALRIVSMNTKSRYANDYLRAGRQPLWWSIDTNRVRNQVFQYACQDVTVMAQLSPRSSLPAISAEVAPFYRVYLGKCGLETYYGWKTNSEKLDSGLCG